MELRSEQLSCYLNNIRSVGLWKCPNDHYLANKAYFSAITVKYVYESSAHKMAAKASWHWNYVTVILCIVEQMPRQTWLLTARQLSSYLLKGPFIAQKLNRTDQNKLTHLHDAFAGHARQLHDLIDCSETRTVSARLVLNTCKQPINASFSHCDPR